VPQQPSSSQAAAILGARAGTGEVLSAEGNIKVAAGNEESSGAAGAALESASGNAENSGGESSSEEPAAGNGETPNAESPTQEPVVVDNALSFTDEPGLGDDVSSIAAPAAPPGAPPAPVLDAPSEELRFSQETLPDYFAVWQGPEPSLVTILLRSSGDRQRDTRRMRRIHALLASYPGNDRFAFKVYEDAGRYDLAFPSSSTRYTPELHRKLLRLVGDNSVHVAALHLH
jgi:hypothetical protein